MRTSNPMENKVVAFYANPMLHAPSKKLIADDHEQAYQEGRNAWFSGASTTENPYSKEDGNAIWSKSDCWFEGYMSGSRY